MHDQQPSHAVMPRELSGSEIARPQRIQIDAPRNRIRVASVVLCLLTLWAYRNSFHSPFILDDHLHILTNSGIRQLWPLSSYLFDHSRPLLSLSLAVNYALSEEHVWSYHVFNFCVHLAAGLLLFGIVRRTLLLPQYKARFHDGATGLAFAVALIWLVHPLQTQSVTYVVQRCESMMGMFYLLCLYAVLRGSQTNRAWPWYVVAVFACCLGLGAKEVMATACAVIPLYDRTFLSNSWREVLRRRWWVYLLFVMATVTLVAVVTMLLGGAENDSAGFGLRSVTPWQYMQSQPGIILHYISLAYWPQTLSLDYYWPVARSAREIYLPGAVIAGMLLASLLALRFRPALGFLGMTFFLILAPTSSFVPIADLAVEHRMYLSLISLIVPTVLSVYAVSQFLHDDKARKLLQVGSLVIVALLLILRTIERNRDYNNPIKLWTDVLAIAPHNDRAHYNLGRNLSNAAEPELAIEHYEEAIRLNPDHAQAHNNLGVLLAAKDMEQEAILNFEAAIRIDPEYTMALTNYGNVYARADKFEEATRYYRKAIEVDVEFAPAHLHLGEIALKQGDLRNAMDELQVSNALTPNKPTAAMWMAWILATADDPQLRDGPRAVEIAERLAGKFGESEYRFLDVMAAAYAEVGRFDAAIEKARAAYHLASAAKQEEDKQAIQARLKQYRAGQPHRLRDGHNLQDKIESALD